MINRKMIAKQTGKTFKLKIPELWRTPSSEISEIEDKLGFDILRCTSKKRKWRERLREAERDSYKDSLSRFVFLNELGKFSQNFGGINNWPPKYHKIRVENHKTKFWRYNNWHMWTKIWLVPRVKWVNTIKPVHNRMNLQKLFRNRKRSFNTETQNRLERLLPRICFHTWIKMMDELDSQLFRLYLLWIWGWKIGIRIPMWRNKETLSGNWVKRKLFLGKIIDLQQKSLSLFSSWFGFQLEFL